jgi:hypothetical protein
MTFTMKMFARASRRAHSRPTARRPVSCETLECRQLLSTGIQTVEAARVMMPAFTSAQWASGWVGMPSMAAGTGTSQVTSNLGNAGLGSVVEAGSVRHQSQSRSGKAAHRFRS